MDEPSLQGVDLKISRAKGHLSDLKEAIKWALDSDRYEFRKEIDPETADHILWVDPIPFVVPEWSVIVGEILFQLRSALDHLAYQLVILDGGCPTDQTKFPIRDSPLDKKGNFIGAGLRPSIKDTKILAALEECQPYSGPERDPLWLLNLLNNIDKHRLLLVVICVLDTGKMWWESSDITTPTLSITSGPFKEGAPIGRIDFHGIQAPEDFDPNPALSIAINEAEAPMIQMQPLDGILDHLCRHVETDILGSFRPLFDDGLVPSAQI